MVWGKPGRPLFPPTNVAPRIELEIHRERGKKLSADEEEALESKRCSLLLTHMDYGTGLLEEDTVPTDKRSWRMEAGGSGVDLGGATAEGVISDQRQAMVGGGDAAAKRGCWWSEMHSLRSPEGPKEHLPGTCQHQQRLSPQITPRTCSCSSFIRTPDSSPPLLYFQISISRDMHGRVPPIASRAIICKRGVWILGSLYLQFIDQFASLPSVYFAKTPDGN